MRARAGDETGSFTNGYWSLYVEGKFYLVHRIVAKMFGLDIVGCDIDHIDGDTTNNAPINLRAVPHAVNSRNRKMPVTNTSGTVGVCKQHRTRNGVPSSRWVAQWYEDNKLVGKSFSVGKYGDAEAFQLAYEHREKMIQNLNAGGADYSDRHGKDV